MEIPDEIVALTDWMDLLLSGATDEELEAKHDVDAESFAKARAVLLDHEREKASGTVEDQYAQYRLRIEGVLRRMDRVGLDAVQNSINAKTGKPSAMSYQVAASLLIAQAKIIDQTVSRGQELGILPRAAISKNVRVSGGLLIGAMPSGQIFDEILRLKGEGDRLLAEYNPVSFVDMPAPDIYDSNVVEVESVSVSAPRRVERKKH